MYKLPFHLKLTLVVRIYFSLYSYILQFFRVGSNENHVQGVKEMVLNTQRANIAKVKQLIDLNLRETFQTKKQR